MTRDWNIYYGYLLVVLAVALHIYGFDRMALTAAAAMVGAAAVNLIILLRDVFR